MKIFDSGVILGSAYSQGHKLVKNSSYYCLICHLVTALFFSLTSASCLPFSSKQKKIAYYYPWFICLLDYSPNKATVCWVQRDLESGFSYAVFQYRIFVLSWAMRNCDHSFHASEVRVFLCTAHHWKLVYLDYMCWFAQNSLQYLKIRQNLLQYIGGNEGDWHRLAAVGPATRLDCNSVAQHDYPLLCGHSGNTHVNGI